MEWLKNHVVTILAAAVAAVLAYATSTATQDAKIQALETSLFNLKNVEVSALKEEINGARQSAREAAAVLAARADRIEELVRTAKEDGVARAAEADRATDQRINRLVHRVDRIGDAVYNHNTDASQHLNELLLQRLLERIKE